MPYEPYQAAYKEALASAKKGVAEIDTIEVSHPLIAEPIRMCSGGIQRILTIEGVPETFEPAGFSLQIPDTDDSGFQDLNIAMDNIDRQVSDFLESVSESQDPVIITYRPFLSNDSATMQSNSALVLELRRASIGEIQVTGTARASNMSNKEFPSIRYNKQLFPNLKR